MKIVADNRGRIALSKLNNKKFSGEVIPWNAPGSEWDVRVEGGEVRITPWNDEPKPEWVKVNLLKPEHIGQPVGVTPERTGILPRAEDYSGGFEEYTSWGTLEYFVYGKMGLWVSEFKFVGQEKIVVGLARTFYVKNV